MAVSIASGSVAAVITRSGPNRSSARSASASTSRARGEPLWVTTIWSNTGSNAAEDAVDVLVGHHRDDADQVAEVELLLQRLGQRGGAGRVVRGVDEHGRGAAHPLQPAGAGNRREARAHRVDVELPLRACAEKRLDGGQRDHSVVRLMFAVQRQEDVGVHPAEALQLEQLTTDGDLPAEHRELRIFPRDRGVGANSLRQ